METTLGKICIGESFIYNDKEYIVCIPDYQSMFLENMVDVLCCDDNKRYKLKPDTKVKIRGDK